jgi:hypothetical protein
MPPDRTLSEAHARLGRALRATRTRAGISTRSVPKTPPAGWAAADPPYYSSGHISLVEAGATAPSPELVEAYAAMPGAGRAELRSLHEQMLAATREAARRRRQGSDTPPGPVPPQDMGEVSSRHDVQQHYVIVSTEADYRFGPSGAIRDVVCTVALRARAAGVRLYYTGFSYPADQRPGVLRVEVLSGAAVLAAQESPSGAVGCYFRLDRELAPDDAEPYAVAFRVAVRSERRAAPRLRYFATGGSEQLLLRAAFDTAADPGSVWWFAVPDIVDAEHPAPGQDVPGEPAAVYAHRFERLVPGWCYGFAWAW